MKQIYRFVLGLALGAGSSLAFANVIGTDAQNFNPTPDGIDFVTVHSSEGLKPGYFNFGFYLNYAENTFPAYRGTAAPSQTLLGKNDSLTSADFNFAFGITQRWQIGFSFPFILDQDIKDSQNIGQFRDQGNTEIRPSTKYFLGAWGSWRFATVGSVNFNRIRNNPYVGDKPNPTYNLELVGDRKFGRWNFGVNVGHRWRNPGEPIPSTGIDPVPDQWLASVGTSYLLTGKDTKLIFEIFGAFPSEKTTNLTDRQNSTLEALAGAKYDWNRQLALHAGLGTELQHGTSTPDWRIYTGLNWSMGPLFAKGNPFSFKDDSRRTVVTLAGLNFDFGSPRLRPDSEKVLDEIISRLRSLGTIASLEVEGHTDSVGNENYNLSLSQARAEYVRDRIVKSGVVGKDRATAIGYGETRPIADNGNFQGREANRRVEIKVERSR